MKTQINSSPRGRTEVSLLQTPKTEIYSPSGEYLNNRLIVMPDFRNTWREVTVDAAGRVFSNRIYKGSFEVYEWK